MFLCPLFMVVVAIGCSKDRSGLRIPDATSVAAGAPGGVAAGGTTLATGGGGQGSGVACLWEREDGSDLKLG